MHDVIQLICNRIYEIPGGLQRFLKQEVVIAVSLAMMSASAVVASNEFGRADIVSGSTGCDWWASGTNRRWTP